MSIDWATIRDWDAAALDDAAQQVQRRVDELSALADELNWTHPQGWHGEASDLARAERVRLVGKYDEFYHETDPLKRALRAASDAVERLHFEQEVVDLVARHHDMFITDAGDLLTDSGTGPPPGSPESVERSKVAIGLRDQIAGILEQAAIIDQELADALLRAAYPVSYPDAQGNQSRLNPPPGGDPKQVNEWWLGLSEEERNELIATRPEWVGSTDGIPAEYRDTANRQVLASQQADLKEQIDRLRDDFENLPDWQKYLPMGDAQDLANQINALETRLDGLNDIQDRLENPGPGQQEAYLLGIDTRNNQGIIAMGNPDTATNVATYIPGTESGIDGDLDDEDKGIREDMRRADSMALAAANADSPSTSVITWVGYTAPQSLSEAAETSYAENAKQDLDRFQDGLRATHEGPRSHNTVIGHSYGSTVIGHTAASENLDADDIVFVGSPGVGVNNVADLNMPAEHVHATVAEHDMIHLSNIDSNIPGINTDIHGPDPTGNDFGANVFTSNPGTESPGYMGGYTKEAHSEYWGNKNKALENMGRIIAGKPTT